MLPATAWNYVKITDHLIIHKSMYCFVSCQAPATSVTEACRLSNIYFLCAPPPRPPLPPSLTLPIPTPYFTHHIPNFPSTVSSTLQHDIPPGSLLSPPPPPTPCLPPPSATHPPSPPPPFQPVSPEAKHHPWDYLASALSDLPLKLSVGGPVPGFLQLWSLDQRQVKQVQVRPGLICSAMPTTKSARLQAVDLSLLSGLPKKG